jgi:hypothetical protein
MSILQTFYILFRTNTAQVQQGARQVQNTMQRLNTSLTTSQGRVDAVGNAFVNVVNGAGRSLAAILAVGKAIEVVNHTIQQTEQLRLGSMATGNTAQQIDNVTRATLRFGGTAEETMGVLKNLNAQILDTAFTGSGSLTPVLVRLGMNLRNLQGDIVKPIEFLDGLNKSFQRITKRESMNLGAQIGLTEPMILMLQQTPEAYKKSIAAAQRWGAVTQQDIALTHKLTTEMHDFKATMGEGTRAIVFSMVPGLTKFFGGLNSIADWMKENGDVVKGFFIGAAAIVTGVYLPAISTAAAATWALLAPIIAMVAAVAAAAAAFALLYDDVMNFSKGNRSLLGDLVKKYPALMGVINGVTDSFKLLMQIFALLKNSFLAGLDVIFLGIKKIPEAWADFISLLRSSSPTISGFIDTIADKFKKLGDFIVFIFSRVGEIIRGTIDGISNGVSYLTEKVNALRGFIGGSPADVMDSMAKAKSATDFAAASPLGSQTSASISGAAVGMSKTIDLKFGDITINAQNADAEGVRNQFTQSLSQHLKMALYNIDDGIAK